MVDIPQEGRWDDTRQVLQHFMRPNGRVDPVGKGHDGDGTVLINCLGVWHLLQGMNGTIQQLLRPKACLLNLFKQQKQLQVQLIWKGQHVLTGDRVKARGSLTLLGTDGCLPNGPT